MSETRQARLQAFEVDVDARLVGLWRVVWEHDLDEEATPDQLATLVRAAYALGYRDSLREAAEGRPAELQRIHNVRLT
jgi:hypothetical protein